MKILQSNRSSGEDDIEYYWRCLSFSWIMVGIAWIFAALQVMFRFGWLNSLVLMVAWIVAFLFPFALVVLRMWHNHAKS